MISSYFYVGILFSFFWGLYFLRKRKYLLTFSKPTLLFFYVLVRLIPVAMLSEIQTGIWRNFICEWIFIFGMICYIRKRKSSAISGCIYCFYLFQPGIILGILSGSWIFLPVMSVFVVILCILDLFIKKQGGSLMAFQKEYLLFSIGIFGLFTAVVVYHQHFTEIVQKKNFPALYIVSLACLGLSAAMGICRLCCRNYHYVHLVRPKAPKRCNCKKEGKLTVKDVLLMFLITLLFASVAFWRVGSTKAPETYRTLDFEAQGNNEIVLEFEPDTYIDKMYIYLGYTGETVMSFSSLVENDTKWLIFKSNYKITSAFCWNEVSINRSIETFGMVLTKNPPASLHEIVLLDTDGNRILPLNASDYKELFDEQDLFPQEVPTSYDQTMFDEVYHGRTAYEFIHGLSIYENTHPPLGKIIIGLGIRAFGMNPFGWRFMCVVLGTLMIPAIYLLAFMMSGSTLTACFTAILFSSEFMHFTLSRIATIDIIVAFFVLLMFLFMYCFTQCCGSFENFGKQILFLVLCGVSTGLAVSTKWTGLYATLGIAVLFFIFLLSRIKDIKDCKRYLITLFLCCCVCFILIPGCIYLLSYIPFTKVYTDKGLLATAISNAQLMLDYHSVTVFDHPYSSEWYSWLFDIRPLMDSYATIGSEEISEILTFGNPVIWWGGLIALFHQFYLWCYKKCENACYLCIAYCSVLFPWFFIHRTVFIYQYFLASNILVLMIGNSLHHLKRKNIWMLVTGIFSVALFILFYPILSGSPVHTDFVKAFLRWLPSWTMVI